MDIIRVIPASRLDKGLKEPGVNNIFLQLPTRYTLSNSTTNKSTVWGRKEHNISIMNNYFKVVDVQIQASESRQNPEQNGMRIMNNIVKAE